MGPHGSLQGWVFSPLGVEEAANREMGICPGVLWVLKGLGAQTPTMMRLLGFPLHPAAWTAMHSTHPWFLPDTGGAWTAVHGTHTPRFLPNMGGAVWGGPSQ